MPDVDALAASYDLAGIVADQQVPVGSLVSLQLVTVALVGSLSNTQGISAPINVDLVFRHLQLPPSVNSIPQPQAGPPPFIPWPAPPSPALLSTLPAVGNAEAWLAHIEGMWPVGLQTIQD